MFTAGVVVVAACVGVVVVVGAMVVGTGPDAVLVTGVCRRLRRAVQSMAPPSTTSGVEDGSEVDFFAC